MTRPNILFICTVNRMRSAAAHKIYADDPRFFVDSAGTDRRAETQVEQEHLEWADFVITMEPMHGKKLAQMFPGVFPRLKIICLNIPDRFDFMEPELVDLLETKFEHVYRTEIAPGQ